MRLIFPVQQLMINSSLIKKINLFCLLLAIIMVLFIPVKKEIWYDETVSILCSKGISHDSPALFANTPTISSATLEQMNTAKNVFDATVVDNANSFLFNIGLHWFTALFGNHISVYVLFSQLCGIAALLAFFMLCNLVFGSSLFTSLALMLLVTDSDFMGMAHEIRAYAMGILFVTLAAAYFYKFLFEEDRPAFLLFAGLFAVAAVLSHFLSVYIILVLLSGLLIVKKGALLSVKNIPALLVPVCLVGIFFWFAIAGLQVMNTQNKQILQRSAGFSYAEVVTRAMKFTAINFKVVFPAFWSRVPSIFVSFLFIVLIYFFSIREAVDGREKRNLRLFFALGISSSIFLAFLCLKSHHYTAIYYRYFSFSIPFTCLFMSYALYVLFRSPRINDVVRGILFSVIVIPVCTLFVLVIRRGHPQVKYNHSTVADEIVMGNVQKMEVPEWGDAFLVNSFLPRGYKIDYVLNPASPNFTLFKGSSAESILVVKNNL